MNLQMAVVLTFLAFLFGSLPLFAQSTQEQITYAFRSSDSLEPTKMIIVGEVIGIDKVSIFKVDKMSENLGVDTRMDSVTVKVSDPNGIRIGQTLYILEKSPNHQVFKDANVVGEITVRSVFQTTFFGWQVRGEGYLRLIEDRPVTAARAIETVKYEEAFFAKRKGDYFVQKGKFDEAIRSFKKAIDLDPGIPDAHYALGKVHWMDGEGYVATGKEFSLAWKNRERFSSKEEAILFYLEYCRFLLYQYQVEGKERSKPLEQMELVVAEAKKAAPRIYEVHFYSAELNFLKAMQLKNDTPETRLKTEELFEQTMESIERAMRLRSSDYLLHKLACEFYRIRWKESRGGTKENIFRERLVEHGKLLRMYYTGETPLSEELLNSIRLAEKEVKALTRKDV